MARLLRYPRVTPVQSLVADAAHSASGPEEIEPHFGKVSLLGLQNRPMVGEVGFPRLLDTEPERTPVELGGGEFEPQLKVVEPRSTLDAIVAKYDTVTTDDATVKWRGQMANLGVPDRHVPTTGTPSQFLYPVHLAINRKNGTNCRKRSRSSRTTSCEDT